MEPKILIVGRLQTTLEIIAEELGKFGRNVIATNDKEKMSVFLKEENIDFVAIGAGLPDEQREELVAIMRSINPNIPIQIFPRTNDASPAKFLHFVNDLAVIFKIHTAMGLRPFSKK